jgi:hypothetical protein
LPVLTSTHSSLNHLVRPPLVLLISTTALLVLFC